MIIEKRVHLPDVVHGSNVQVHQRKVPRHNLLMDEDAEKAIAAEVWLL